MAAEQHHANSGRQGDYPVMALAGGGCVMSPTKQAAIELINSLPDDCTLDDIQYHLFVRRSVERGLKDIENGRVLSVDEMERRVGQWLTSSGPTKRENG
jgi:hypothetical protein